MDDAPLTRRELMDGYEHPYARWIPAAWRYERVQLKLAIAGLASLAALAADQTGGPDTTLLILTLFVAASALTWALGVTIHAALIIRDRIADWQPSAHELAAVRAKRPHAAEADVDLAHAEYAVAVGEKGDLVTWRFTPLRADETITRGVLLSGTPRYSAIQVGSRPYDPVDAARAAEQLADAQQEAAALERAAIERAHQRVLDHHAARELEQEVRSTGAALRDITGQSSP